MYILIIYTYIHILIIYIYIYIYPKKMETSKRPNPKISEEKGCAKTLTCQGILFQNL